MPLPKLQPRCPQPTCCFIAASSQNKAGKVDSDFTFAGKGHSREVLDMCMCVWLKTPSTTNGNLIFKVLGDLVSVWFLSFLSHSSPSWASLLNPTQTTANKNKPPQTAGRKSLIQILIYWKDTSNLFLSFNKIWSQQTAWNNLHYIAKFSNQSPQLNVKYKHFDKFFIWKCILFWAFYFFFLKRR